MRPSASPRSPASGCSIGPSTRSRPTASTDVCFIGGYQIDKVKADYPQFTFRHNPDWENNNILASLFYADDLMDEPFICCYSDVLFTPDVVARLGGVAGRHGARRRYGLARALRASHRPSARRCGKGDRRERPRHARRSADSRSARPTASTSAWRSSRPPARPGCASIIDRCRERIRRPAVARGPACSKRPTRFCCFRT